MSTPTVAEGAVVTGTGVSVTFALPAKQAGDVAQYIIITPGRDATTNFSGATTGRVLQSGGISVWRSTVGASSGAGATVTFKFPEGAYTAWAQIWHCEETANPSEPGTPEPASMPARGFYSGVSMGGAAASPAAFGTWRGDPVDAVSVWMDGADGQHWGAVGSDSRLAFNGLLDVAIGGPSTWTSSSGLDGSFRTFMRGLKARRTIGGVVKPTIVRAGHEMNGWNWYPWQIGGDSAEVAGFKATMRRWSQIRREEFPEALWAFCGNGESGGGTVLADLFEAGVYDIVGADRYNQWNYIGTAKSGKFTSFANESLRGSATNPVGVERWRLFAAERGLPLYFPEYGNAAAGNPDDQCGTDPYWIQQKYAWMRANAGRGAGQVFAEMYFDEVKEGNKWHLLGGTGVATLQPAVAAAYRDIHPIA